MLLSHFFARIEDVGDVQGGSLYGHREGEHDGEPAFHVDRSQAGKDVTLHLRPNVCLPGNCVEVSSEKHPGAVRQLGPCDDSVSEPLGLQPPGAPEVSLDRVRKLRFVVTDRRDGHDLRRQREQVGGTGSSEVTSSGGDTMLPEHPLQLRLVVSDAWIEPPHDERACHEELATRVIASPGCVHDDAPRRNHAPADLVP